MSEGLFCFAFLFISLSILAGSHPVAIEYVGSGWRPWLADIAASCRMASSSRDFGVKDRMACPGSADEAAVCSLGSWLLESVRWGMGWLTGALLAMLSWADVATASPSRALPFPVL